MKPIRPLSPETKSPKVEKVRLPEKQNGNESLSTQEAERNFKETAVGEEKALTVIPVPPAPAAQTKDPEIVKIEEILTKNIGELYASLPDNIKPKFKKTGEETAQKVQKALMNAKSAAGKILRLVRKWLSMIPGVSKFFIEQESKIKTDQLLKLKENK